MSHFENSFVISICLLLLGFAQTKGQNTFPVIPDPQNVSVEKGTFTLNNEVKIEGQDPKLDELKNYFEEQLLKHFNINLANTTDGHKSIVFKIDHSIYGKEYYSLKITSDRITIAGGSLHGIFNGIQSLLQLCFASKEDDTSLTFQNYTISDAPRYQWRGFMVDEARHFFGKVKIKQFLDLMALFKLNVFHWHLTDEPGWRIQIDGYPKLTSVGAKGNYSNPDAPIQYNSHEWGRKWDGIFSDLESVYEFPSKLNIDVEDYSNIAGIQANLWTEAVTTDKRFDFMAWPRLAAMAETAWTRTERKSYPSFKKRLPYLFNILDHFRVYYFNPLNLSKNKEPKGVNEPSWQANH